MGGDVLQILPKVLGLGPVLVEGGPFPQHLEDGRANPLLEEVLDVADGGGEQMQLSAKVVSNGQLLFGLGL